jgi:hypothetical protein
MVSGGGQRIVAARQVVGVSGHAGDGPPVASLDGGEAWTYTRKPGRRPIDKERRTLIFG